MIFLTVPVVQLKLQNITLLNTKGITSWTVMLNELTHCCVPVADLNIVLFGIPTSDFHTNYRIIVTAQKYILGCKKFER